MPLFWPKYLGGKDGEQEDMCMGGVYEESEEDEEDEPWPEYEQ